MILFYRKLKLYEEQELTMQVFSEPENLNKSLEASPVIVSNKSFVDFHNITIFF